MRQLAILLAVSILSEPVVAAEPARPGERLRAVIADYWNDLLKRHPLEATIFVGDHRYDDRLNDPSVKAYESWIASLRQTREALAAIGPAGLTPSERVDREVLAGMIDDRLELTRFGDHLIPLTQLARASTDVHSDDLHLVFTQLGDFHPASTAGDVENYVRRLKAFPKLAGTIVEVLQQGMLEKRMPPRVAVARVVPQLRALASPKAEDSPLWAFLNRLPTDWPDADRRAAHDRVLRAIVDDVAPAYGRLADFVEKEYLPACRSGVGLSDTPDGVAHYAFLVRHYTTTDMTPDQVHETGLAALATDAHRDGGGSYEGGVRGRPECVPDPRSRRSDAQEPR